MTKIIVAGNNILINGIQQGPNYSSHRLALREAITFRNKHYPNAPLVDQDAPHDSVASDAAPKTEQSDVGIIPV